LAPSISDKDRSKILIGLNFYGYDYTTTGGHPIFGNSYLELLRKTKSIKWSDDIGEHYFEAKYVLSFGKIGFN